MDLNNVPSKEEVMGWDPRTLADYMKRLKLPGCDKVVMRENISGAQFMDDDSDHDYEDQDYEDQDYEVQDKEAERNYFCALSGPQTAEEQDSDDYEDETMYKGNFKPPSPPHKLEPPQHRRPSTAQDCHFRADPPNVCIKPNKPVPPVPPQKDKRGDAIKALGTFKQACKLRLQKSTDPPNKAASLTPAPPVRTQPAKVTDSKPGPRKGLDPSWYGGKMTRYQAETVLKEVNKDGAFMVRDSSKGSGGHPYTLMVLIKGKIYNIKIRNQGNSYSLGTGHRNTERFPGVKEMITHHTHTPLLLIDGTDSSSEAHSESCLLYPVGL
ncbi:hypothetical protein PAMA_017579 [Pampus argenteus]